ncbi:hypothetical protein LOY46_17180 [Pseudomonas sichuanensis]|uniref:hypothetical protein n=1 Tax=Pseudomonas sichuanensis TaxID=2213015 RepID=UPI00215F20C2|nr:hypothetical protein [Pseudomonas sichuanensis]UVK81300.1 hypothetical protein LOY46_17180 [Pseudomonas sichuanensis]
MSAINGFHEVANDALVMISDHLRPEAKLTLVIYTPGEPEQDIVLKGPGVDADEVVSTMRRRGGLSLDSENAYKRGLCDVIVGSLACGKQNNNPPPDGHWGRQFWEIGRAEGAAQQELLLSLAKVTDCLTKALTGGEVPAGHAGRALTEAGELIIKYRS